MLLLHMDTRFWAKAKTLYETLKGEDKEPIAWTPECHHVFDGLKVKLSSPPMLGLPNLQKKSTLHIAEKQGIALGVLTRN